MAHPSFYISLEKAFPVGLTTSVGPHRALQNPSYATVFCLQGGGRGQETATGKRHVGYGKPTQQFGARGNRNLFVNLFLKKGVR